MSVGELTTNELMHELTTAEAVYNDLLRRRTDLERFNNLEGYDIAPPELVLAETDHFMFDLSGQPGGAFKYVSALGGGLTAPAGAETFATASAGNFSGTLGQVCTLLGMKGKAYVPYDVSAAKVASMEGSGMTVEAHYADVSEALPAAEADCEADPSMAFLHPYNNPNGIAALTVLGDQVIDNLLKLEADGQVDLSSQDVKFLVQRGGGSLITAMAISLRHAKNASLLGENVSIVEVRPEQLGNDQFDPLFDGLKVGEPGSVAAPILADSDYVAGTHQVSRAAVADAARRVAAVSNVTYESNALAGVGAYEELRRDTDEPTVFVTLLTGRNAAADQRQFLLGLPGLEQNDAAPDTKAEVSYSVSQHTGSAVLSGYTQRGHTPYPTARMDNPNRYIPNQEVMDEYYAQLEELGIVLAAASQYHR